MTTSPPSWRRSAGSWTSIGRRAGLGITDERPLVSIVTPSYQSVRWIERTIRSVLEQDYERIELHVMDGGSTDGTVDVIKRYADRLASWTSGPDAGQADAVRRGFERCRGTILAYLNADDAYVPGAVGRIVETFRRTGADLVFGDVRLVDEHGRRIRDLKFTEFDLETFLYEGGNVNQAGAFWTRELYDRVGGIDPTFRFALDNDFVARAAEVGRFAHHRGIVAEFRIHPGSKTSTIRDVGLAEWERIRRRRMDPSAPRWREALIRVRAQLRRTVGYVRQGDAGYVLRGLLARLLRRPKL